MASISLRNVTKEYESGTAAVHGFNLEIADKEFIVLVGPSGCGKSTTLRMIAGLEEITSGDLIIGETKVNDIPPKDRDIAMVFQNYALYPHMTVYKNMAFGLELRKVPKNIIRQKVEEAAIILGIEDILDRKPKALSGGQQQRVALGRAMVRDPAVFLLDEPLSNLDAKLRNTMRAEISKLHKRLNATFIYVTHDQVEAMTMGDRIVVMKDGYIQQVDTPQNLYEKPCNLFVAGFIGSPQMNFLRVVIKKVGVGYTAIFNGIPIPLPASKTRNLAEYVGKEVILGIRPENLHDNAFHLPQNNVCHVPAVVELAEIMGSEIYLHLSNHDTRMIAKLPPHSDSIDKEVVNIVINCDKIHLFDPVTEQVICN